MSKSNSSSSSDDEINTDLEKRIKNFVANRKNLLFNQADIKDNEKISIDDGEKNQNETNHLYLDLPPIETFMNISSKNRREHLFKLIEKGDIIIASINEIKQDCIKMTMTCFDNKKRRDLDYTRFDIICPIEYIPEKYISSNGDGLSILKTSFYKNDLLRCLVVDFDHENSICKVSLKWVDDLIKTEDFVENKLGLISSDELPIYYENISYYEKEPYLYNKKLKRQRLFNNPGFINLMMTKLNLYNSNNLSLMKELNDIKIHKNEMAPELHKQQNKMLALQSVQKGVALFREGKSNDAILSYNKALSIDTDNVEALVARGALYASDGDFDKAIKDLEKALLIDSTHSNARVYLKEVFIAYATRHEKNENFDDSLMYLKKSLEIDPKNDLILSKIEDIKLKIEDSYNKNRYGPSLPRQISSNLSYKSQSYNKSKSKKSKNREQSRSDSSTRSRSSSSSEDSKISSRKFSTSRSQSIDTSNKCSRKSFSHADSKFSKKTSLQKNCETKYQDDSDNEDLEEFYNKLKKNKGSNNSFR